MTRILDLLAFWRKNRNSSSRQQPSRSSHRPILPSPSSSAPQSSLPIDHALLPTSPNLSQPSPPNDQPSPSAFDSKPVTFLVPDLDDIRPFLHQNSGDPISMRDLLNAISSSSTHTLQNHLNPFHRSPNLDLHHPLNVQLNKNPITAFYQQFSMKSKRKLDQSSPDQDRAQDPNSPFDRTTRSNSNRPINPDQFGQPSTTASSYQSPRVPLESFGTRFKRPRLMAISSSNSNHTLHQSIKSDSDIKSPTSTTQQFPNQTKLIQPHSPPQDPNPIQLIHGLPLRAWSQIFHHNQLSTLRALIPDRSSGESSSANHLSNQVKLALDAQEHRHSLIRLSKSLAPIARQVAWSTLVLGTARMIDQVAQRLESDNLIASHIESCITVILPPSLSPSYPLPISTPTPTHLGHSIGNGHLPPSSDRTPSKSTTTSTSYPYPQRPPSTVRKNTRNHNLHHPNHGRQSLSFPKQVSVPPSSCSAKKCERFQSVLIPSLPLSKKLATSRNTKLNSLRTAPTVVNQVPDPSNTLEDDNNRQIEEIILAGSLPSLLLSIARSIKLFCVRGDERLSTRALKSLSVLSSLLGGLNELYIDGGGQFSDLSTLVDGLRSITIRGSKGASLRLISVTGPLSTLTTGFEHRALPSSQSLFYPSPPFARSSTSASSKTFANNPNHIAVNHLILGNGMPLTPEQLHWLVYSVTEQSVSKGLKTLIVCLKADLEPAPLPNLSSSVSSIGSTCSSQTRKPLSSSALLSRTFERIGASLERLSVSEDWSSPLTSHHGDRSVQSRASLRKVTFEDHVPCGGEGLLDEPIAFCHRLESLSLPDGPLCSIGLLNVLPFTLKTIEIHDSGSSLEDASQGHLVGFKAEDIWTARSQAALFGLEKIRLVSDPLTVNSHPLFKKWRKSSYPGGHSLNGLEKLERVGIQIEWISKCSPLVHRS